jgi:hypothetical protein
VTIVLTVTGTTTVIGSPRPVGRCSLSLQLTAALFQKQSVLPVPCHELATVTEQPQFPVAQDMRLQPSLQIRRQYRSLLRLFGATAL